MKKLAKLLPVLLCAMSLFAQQPSVAHNGTWWHNKSSLYKEAFVNGYRSGARINGGHETGFSAFGGTELVDGMNTFYRDFRNRNIVFSDAIAFVADQLRGVSEDKLNAALLKARAAAATTIPVE